MLSFLLTSSSSFLLTSSLYFPLSPHSDWVAKLTEAKNTFNKDGAKVVSLSLFSMGAVKAALSSEAERAQVATQQAQTQAESSDVVKAVDKTVKDAEKEVQKDEVTQQV